MDVLRICLHLGNKYDYATNREALKWEIHPEEEHQFKWDSVVYSPEYEQFGEVAKALGKNEIELFCGFPHYLEYANNLKDIGNNGIIIGENTYDAQNKKASIEWTREFDAQGDNSVTLMANQEFKVWLQWGTFKRTDDPMNSGPQKTLGMKDISTPKDMVIPIPPITALDSSSTWIRFGTSATLALVASTLY